MSATQVNNIIDNKNKQNITLHNKGVVKTDKLTSQQLVGRGVLEVLEEYAEKRKKDAIFAVSQHHLNHEIPSSSKVEIDLDTFMRQEYRYMMELEKLLEEVVGWSKLCDKNNYDRKKRVEESIKAERLLEEVEVMAMKNWQPKNLSRKTVIHPSTKKNGGKQQRK